MTELTIKHCGQEETLKGNGALFVVVKDEDRWTAGGCGAVTTEEAMKALAYLAGRALANADLPLLDADHMLLELHEMALEAYMGKLEV